MKKLGKKIFIFILLVLSTLNVYASTKTYDRNQLDNYGVKKNWKIDENNKENVLRTKAVDASERIYDYAELLTEEEENELKKVMDDFVENMKMDIVIVTDSFSYTLDKDNEDYAADFYDYNDFGMQFEKNSGILLLRNANPSDPYYDMYTFGNAQLYFTPARYDSILDGIYPDLHSGNYLAGFKDFVNRTTEFIETGIPKEMENYYVDKNSLLKKHKEKIPYTIPWGSTSLISVIITSIIMAILIKKNKMVAKAHKATEYLNQNAVKITNRKDVFLTSHTSSYTTSSDSGGGGFSSSIGSSGGGHSSGGGRHG